MRVEVARLRVENTALAELNEALDAQVAMLTPEPIDPNDMSNPRARLMKRLQEIADRADALERSAGCPDDELGAAQWRANRAERQCEELQAQLDATDNVVETQRLLIKTFEEEAAA